LSDDGFSDSPYVHNARPRPARQSVPGELIDEFYAERTKKFYRVELRDRGRWGTEAQIFDPVELVIGQRFADIQDGDQIVPARESAIAWAKDMRRFIEKDGDNV
jgi:hypothetical protein